MVAQRRRVRYCISCTLSCTYSRAPRLRCSRPAPRLSLILVARAFTHSLLPFPPPPYTITAPPPPPQCRRRASGEWTRTLRRAGSGSQSLLRSGLTRKSATAGPTRSVQQPRTTLRWRPTRLPLRRGSPTRTPRPRSPPASSLPFPGGGNKSTNNILHWLCTPKLIYTLSRAPRCPRSCLA